MASGSAADWVMAGANVVLAVAAWRAVSAWRHEAVGKYQLELSRKCLALTYEAADRLTDILRSHTSLAALFNQSVDQNISVDRKRSIYALSKAKESQEFFRDFLILRYDVRAAFPEQDTIFMQAIPHYYDNLVYALYTGTLEDESQRFLNFNDFSETEVQSLIQPAVQHFAGRLSESLDIKLNKSAWAAFDALYPSWIVEITKIWRKG
ncbi:hypothetical protein [Aureimonas altamirensis]|uniref:hypothetical protein n=1 Tax=Aureimonas altamirensis TaxID=370622 RepID=UPI003015D649